MPVEVLLLHTVSYSHIDKCKKKGKTNSIEYLHTTITLNEADLSFGNTLAINEATSSGLKSTDNGKTWSVSSIQIQSIQSHTYNL
jgi:hypothetical protein